MATLSAPVDTKKLDRRRISNDTLCSSNSSCVLQKRNQLHPLAASIKYRSSNNNSVKQRVLSAKYLRFKTLQNELHDANFHIAQLISENKLLKNLQKRQDHALSKYEGTNAEIPKMIGSHQEEIRIQQARTKNFRKNIRELNEQIKSKDEELTNLRDQNKHFMNICRNKNLDEREKLSKKVEELEDMIRHRDSTISTLNRKLVLETKNCKFKLATEFNKNKTLQKELLKAQSQIDELSNVVDGKEMSTERKLRRNASNDRKKSIMKLPSPQEREEKPCSSGKKPNGNYSTSSLILSEENDSCDLTILEKNQNEELQINGHDDFKNNNEENDQSSSGMDYFSSELQLKSVVNNLQKKNSQDSLKDNLNEYCSGVIDRAANYTKTVDKHTVDFANSEKEMESLLSALKETDEISKKFNRVSVSSPVLDFTDLFKNRDKNANVINKKNYDNIGNSTLDLGEYHIPKEHQKINLESYSCDLDGIVVPKSRHKINLDTNGSSRLDLEGINLTKTHETKSESNGGSTSDSDEYNYSQKSQRSCKSEVVNEGKEKLLAKLKAIDNGENIEFSAVKKTKNDLIKELFG